MSDTKRITVYVAIVRLPPKIVMQTLTSDPLGLPLLSQGKWSLRCLMLSTLTLTVQLPLALHEANIPYQAIWIDLLNKPE